MKTKNIQWCARGFEYLGMAGILWAAFRISATLFIFLLGAYLFTQAIILHLLADLRMKLAKLKAENEDIREEDE